MSALCTSYTSAQCKKQRKKLVSHRKHSLTSEEVVEYQGRTCQLNNTVWALPPPASRISDTPVTPSPIRKEVVCESDQGFCFHHPYQWKITNPRPPPAKLFILVSVQILLSTILLSYLHPSLAWPGLPCLAHPPSFVH